MESSVEPETSITICIVEHDLGCFGIFVPSPTSLIKVVNSGSSFSFHVWPFVFTEMPFAVKYFFKI